MKGCGPEGGISLSDGAVTQTWDIPHIPPCFTRTLPMRATVLSDYISLQLTLAVTHFWFTGPDLGRLRDFLFV